MSTPVPCRKQARPLLLRLRLRALSCGFAGLLAGTGAGVSAQTETADAEGLGGQFFRLTPRVGISETVTDNLRLSDIDRESEAITELSAGVSLERQGGRVQGYLEYTLTGVLHARRDTASDTYRHDLNAAGRAELIDEFAYLEARADIARQAISPFGAQSVDDTLDNPNRTEVKSYSLAPSLRGRLGRRASYEARLSYAAMDAGDAVAADVRELESSVEAGTDPGERLGWGVHASRDIVDYRLGRRTETDSATATLRAAPDPTLLLFLTGGRDSSDVLSLEKRSSRRYGFGLDWRPSERTRLAFEREHRYFGRSHSLVFSHRMPRSIWTYSDVQEVRSAPDVALGGRGTVFDLFYRQFASIEPDAGRRAALVSDFLRANGLDPDVSALNSYLTTALTLERRQAFTVAYSGMRSVALVSAQQTRTRRLDPLGADALFGTGPVRQRGAAFTIARRLTPSASLTLGIGQQNSRGELDARSSRLRSYTATWTDRLGQRMSLSIGARHVRFESAAPYRENAVVARLSAEF